MKKKQIHRLLVLNRRKRIVGILSFGDIGLHEPTGEVVEAISRILLTLARPHFPCMELAMVDGKAVIDTLNRVGLPCIKYPYFDQVISSPLLAAVREEARQLRWARASASLEEICLAAVLAALIDRGLLTPALEAKADNSEPVGRDAARRHAA